MTRETDADPERAQRGVERVLRELANVPSAHERWNDGADCPSESVLAAFAERRLAAERETDVRGHLEHCGACVGDVRAALEELAEAAGDATGSASGPTGVVSTPVQGEAPPRPTASPGLRLVRSTPFWAALAAAAALLLLFGPFGGGGDGGARRQAAELARVEAIPARVPRGPAEEAELAFREGLGLYQAERWADAEAQLAQAQELAPERTDVALYRGSALLLLGRAVDAIEPLERATAADGAQGREARWQLAQALLQVGRIEDAAGELERLAGDGHRGADATERLAELHALGF